MSLLLLLRQAAPVVVVIQAGTAGYQARTVGRQWRAKSTLRGRFAAVAAGRSWKAKA